MPSPQPRFLRAAALAAALAFVPALAACSQTTQAASTASPNHSTDKALPSSHVHGLTVSGEPSQVLLATHDGLFDMTKNPSTKIGDTNDLMGFTAGADGVFYASGHPGPGSSLPNPLGLLKSTDGGKTWEQLSRQGESDFHAMAATKSGIIAFDGQLRFTRDGKAWDTVAAGFAPAVLAGHPDTDTVLATTEAGIQRSTDGGKTWDLVPNGPVIQFTAFADPDEVVGAAPDGNTYYSPDAGLTWTRKGRIDGKVQAIAAVNGSTGSPWFWAATTDGIVVSTDAGGAFRPADER
ncbi:MULTISPECIES: F510_1955 family glycosylhydrolase [Paenarthrobacter]|uniref:F510_1955 family glycosylhydrolase n=1 Tax=Paenarthrobacter TaxID=1742992 RepID=UPI001877C58A|nr:MULTISPECIES: exo-alpha-sialidase [Paenarthrobacter]QOT19779.1 exo-alpha-sialidase [Paenarthrobacter sp. YJN-5]UOD83362.1 exo-alpha-sialidase [Paenarthrobacter ureafaciens]WNZ04309.1 exo-alpha-sialidase [Paenarthrobacter ureafaciens]